MQKIRCELQTVVKIIEDFYRVEKHHFVTINGVEIEKDVVQIQWIFSHYDTEELFVFYVECSYDVILPSISFLIPNAYISQMELTDMFGIQIQDTKKGLYLEKDSKQAPLRDIK